MISSHKMFQYHLNHFLVHNTRGTTYDGFSGQFCLILEIIILCFVVAILDLVHNDKAINSICFC